MTSPKPPSLPPEKVFSIQIGTELFRLSGASIASDGQAPSYFSRFFEEQWKHANSDGSNIRTLYIDRDPTTFKDIARHLQGYHVQPKDGEAFVKLFADAQFYSLPRLISQLFESEIIIQIGDRPFKIPRDIFSGPGDSPNFFTLGFGAFFASPTEVFPGLNRDGLLRPPAIIPPSVPNRSGDIFAQLLHLLRGYPLQIRDETHRAELLRDCRYFHLRGLEQKLIPHHISVSPSTSRSEILLRLEDVRRSGIRLAPPEAGLATGALRVQYARPFVDENPHDLILEIGSDSTILPTPGNLTGEPKFLGLTGARFASLAQIIAGKATAEAGPPASPPRVLAAITSTTDLTVDGVSMAPADAFHDPTISTDAPVPAKRRRVDSELPDVWYVRNGHWDVRFTQATTEEPPTVFLMAAKLDVYTDARQRHKARAFLGS
ncbi:hypothetical protein BDV59DRAFT_203479 [Aspergillus ambiguus]|uniref:uncharacterized protein n=1 Tax=Aspergillus ambiguus TaxID=176160 RepID=UPI003CCD6536